MAGRGTTELLGRLGVELPVVQAGMGGGVARHGLAAAVSEAGGLGTIGIADADVLAAELRQARAMTGRPIAVNLLLPFTQPAHWKVAADADAVITFWGVPLRRSEGVWLHQCGSVQEARQAQAAGADGVIAQGVQAGGHVRGELPALELLERIRVALPDYPVLLAGGVATAADVRTALEAGAAATVLGTRFLLSEESDAHPGYKRRLLEARETLLTTLFGLGWPAQHRVVPNAATERWLGPGARTPSAIHALNRAAAPLSARIPLSLTDRIAKLQSPRLPLFNPSPPVTDSPERMLDAAPLYAGETVARLDRVQPAGQLVRELAA